MKNIIFVLGAILMLAGIVAVGVLTLMVDSLKIQMGLGDYELAKQLGLLGLGGFIAMGLGWLVMKKTE